MSDDSTTDNEDAGVDPLWLDFLATDPDRKRKWLFVYDLEVSGSSDSTSSPEYIRMSESGHAPILEIGFAIVERATLEIADARTYVISPYDQGWRDYVRALPVVEKMHTDNGLIEAIESGTGQSLAAVENEILGLLRQYDPKGRQIQSCGSGIAWFDRRHIAAQMPRLDKYLSRKLFDVAVIREFVRGHRPELLRKPNKTHRALDDVYDCIDELRHFTRVLLDVPLAGKI